MSRIKCVGDEAKASIDPLAVGTIAIFDVIAPSAAFRVDASGCGCPFGHKVRKPNDPAGTTVALKT
jgi:hypothetical protein